MAYHHRTAAIALALALAAGAPAAAAAQQPGSPATGSPCSEVCSGGGYPSAPGTTSCPAYSLPTILNHLGNPPPCSDVCSGGGDRWVSPPSQTPDTCSAYHPARIPPAAVRVAAHSAAFHWGDAGIGAGAMLAVIMIGLGGPLTVTRRLSHRIHDYRPWTLPSPHPGPAVADADLDIIGMPDHRPTRDTRSQ
ncbi:MAG TPA: hypothetical protein VK284_06945 [Streptosporangiaceae bacterium]|nr:hypothetical protein [Streptosporangiaceae bacterium]